MHLRMSSAEWQPICVSLILLTHDDHLDNLLVVEDCSNSIANALELPQYCTKPSIYWPPIFKLEWAASNGNRYPPYPQVMATAISQ